MRAGMVVLGLALGVLWIVGLESGAPSWLSWLDFCAALLSLLSAIVPDRVPALLHASPYGIGVGLLALWIVALAIGESGWMAWWTFGFGVAFLLLGVGVSMAPVERIGSRDVRAV